ncbi:MAG TPA: aldehyde dehydrogenase family protein, partial [Eoetvoesiella sp.]
MSESVKTIFINGKWSQAHGGGTINVVAPSNGESIGSISRGVAQDIDAAVAAARQAFEGVWGNTAAVDRGRLLSRLGLKIAEHAEELAQLEALDTGKAMKLARSDVAATARYFEYYGGAADKLHGETIPFLEGYQVLIVREPRGVAGHIIPWNYPAQMFGRTIAAALAAGNTTVLKPAEEACLSIIRLTELAEEVGIPPGVVN